MPSPTSALERPVFLVGTTRSGTTLLSLILGHHSQVDFVGELEWAFDFDMQGRSLEAFHAALEVDRAFRLYNLRIDRSLAYDDLIRSFLRQLSDAGSPGKPIVGNQVHRHYAQLLRIWPNARFIHIVRDGRDVAASWMKLGWNGNTWSSAKQWQSLLTQWAAVRRQIDPARRIEIRFEDLIADPERALPPLCAFLGVDYEPEMLRYHEASSYGRVDPSQAGKWPKHLSPWDIRVFESIAGETLTQHGYELSGLPPLDRAALLSPALFVDDSVRRNRSQIRSLGTSLWLAEQLTRRLRLGRLHDRVQLQINSIVNRTLR